MCPATARLVLPATVRDGQDISIGEKGQCKMTTSNLDEIDSRLHTARSFVANIKQLSDGQRALQISVEIQQAMDHLTEAIRIGSETRRDAEFDGGGRRIC